MVAMKTTSTSSRFFVRLLVCVAIVGLNFSASVRVTAQDSAGVEFYDSQVKPLLEAHCFECHREDPDYFAGEFALASRQSMIDGGDSGSSIDFDNVDESLLLRVLSYEDDAYQMPPEGRLDDEEIAVFRKWIELGLPWNPDDEFEIDSDGHGPPPVNDETKQWWSFQKVRRPDVPELADSNWATNEIDHFIGAKLAAENLTPAPQASKQQLVRRAYYDLTGLPPTPQQVEKFVNDSDPNAWSKLIEQLLASPHYGEKWGRHWLDLVGYAESNSFERDGTKPFVWQYRDYVMQSFNDDKPYDQFLREQLAGDEFENVTVESMTATGFYRLGAWDDEPADPKLAKYDELSQIVTVVGQSMMGLTVDCARCHDHKIDPIPHADYYKMVSFFENIRRFGQRDQKSVFDASVTRMEERSVSDEVRAEHDAKLADVVEQLAAIEDPVKEHFEPVEHEEFKRIANRERVLKKYVGERLTKDQFETYKDLQRDLKRLTDNPPQGIRKILSVKEHGETPPKSYIQIRGNPHAQGDEVQPGFLSVLSPPEPKVQPIAGGNSTGRRLAFANWVADGEHPLTARVMANRLWQYHFGRGIVRSSSDFGFQGSPPTHPELLDWLAAEFVAANWSIKSMHRKIMLSQSYQMSTKFSDESYAADPENDHFWRFNPRRLTAEEIRDSILAVTGQLNLAEVYGPSIHPALPAEVLAGQSMPGKNWRPSEPDEARRRSVYIHVKRTLGFPILEINDAATTDSPCPVRFVTTQPTQAIGMINSKFTNDQADHLAKLVSSKHNEPESQVAAVLRRVLQREPDEREVDRGLALLNDPALTKSGSQEDALRIFCVLALNLNEFVYLQ